MKLCTNCVFMLTKYHLYNLQREIEIMQLVKRQSNDSPSQAAERDMEASDPNHGSSKGNN